MPLVKLKSAYNSEIVVRAISAQWRELASEDKPTCSGCQNTRRERFKVARNTVQLELTLESPSFQEVLNKCPIVHSVLVGYSFTSIQKYPDWKILFSSHRITLKANGDIENKFKVTKGERLGKGINLEFGTDIYTLLYLKDLLYSTTPVLLPGKSHGWRSLVGCSPWGR